MSSGSCIPALGQWGRCKETIGDEIQLVTENQNVYILLSAKHGTANRGRAAMCLVEDSIVRY